MTAPDLSQFDVLSFDCYGTIVDWETSMLGALQPILRAHDVHVVDHFLLRCVAMHEPELQSQGGRYRDVLEGVLRRIGERLAFVPSKAETARFVQSIAESPPFADSCEALKRLSRRFSLAVLSNTDADLFEVTEQSLGVDFAARVLAGDVGAYKPDLRMFQALRDALPKGARILHVAQSRFHDIVPASSLGWPTVWIDRSAGRADAVKPVQAQPTWTLSSLEPLASAILGAKD